MQSGSLDVREWYQALCVVLVFVSLNAWSAPGSTWDGGYPSAEAACRDRIAEGGSVTFSHAEVRGNHAKCFCKKTEGPDKKPWEFVTVSRDQPSEPESASDGKSEETAATTADECAKLAKLSEKKLKMEVIARFEKVVEKANNEIRDNPALVTEEGLLSDAEIAGISKGVGGVSYVQGKKLVLNEKGLTVIYGHIIERLTARRLETLDPCLPTYLEYIPNTTQMNTPGGSPDFKGIGKAAGLQVDITTEAEMKRKIGEGKAYDFILYTRKLKMNAAGHVVKAN